MTAPSEQRDAGCVSLYGSRRMSLRRLWLSFFINAGFLVVEFVGGEELPWELMRMVMMSRANTSIFQLQDVLGLGTQGRMNTPSVPRGNWHWRCPENALEQS
ncbi:4-alpha-glucanotransferase, partial [Candidatus Latescibacterota bacterium]